MPKLPSKWLCSGNYEDNNSSCDQWDNTCNYRHDISWRNNGDHVPQLVVMMSFVNWIIRKCMGQWQCSWGQISISRKQNKLTIDNHLCRAAGDIYWQSDQKAEWNSRKYLAPSAVAGSLRLSVSVRSERTSFFHLSSYISAWPWCIIAERRPRLLLDRVGSVMD